MDFEYLNTEGLRLFKMELYHSEANLVKSTSSSQPSQQLLSLALSDYSDLRSSHVQRVVQAANDVRAARDKRNDLGLKMTEVETRRAVRERVETEWIS